MTEMNELNAVRDARRISMYDIKITEMLLKLGIRPNCSGYKYLRHAILLACFTPDIASYVTKNLYPKLAKSYKVNAESISRTCRRAVDTAYNCKNNAEIIKCFRDIGIDRKPTCSEFVSTVASLVIGETELYNMDNQFEK